MADRKERLTELLRFLCDEDQPAVRRFTVAAQMIAELEEWLKDLEAGAKAEGHSWPDAERFVDVMREALKVDSPGIAIDLTGARATVRAAGETERQLVEKWLKDPESLPRASCALG
jgi:hypothetical protein